MSDAVSAGEPGKAVAPKSSSLAIILGVVRLALISWFSAEMIFGEVLLGAPTASHELLSKPGRISSNAGTSGSIGERFAVVTARARIWPFLMYWMDAGRLSKATCTCPLRRSVSIGAEP